jgi:Skp family chaperone for outer membrane proteins
MSKINVYVTTRQVKQNSEVLLDKMKTLDQDLQNYLNTIHNLEATLEKQAKELEEKKKAEALKNDKKHQDKKLKEKDYIGISRKQDQPPIVIVQEKKVGLYQKATP